MRALAPSLAFLSLISVTAPAVAAELDDLARAADSHPDDVRACDAFAAAALKQKRYDEAIQRLKVTVARVADYSEGYYKLAYAYRQKHAWADSADYYRRTLALDPSRSDTWFGLGAALQGLGDAQGAVAAYQKYIALERSPNKQRFVDEAKAEIAQLQHAAPVARDAAGLRARADELRAASQLAEAAVAYQRAIAADPTNLELYNDLGGSYFALQQYDDAAKAFAAATARDAGYALAWYNQGHALRKAERWRESADAYRRYLKLKPDDPDAQYGLGEACKGQGDRACAVAALSRYIALEKRPEEQKWVDKARAELQSLKSPKLADEAAREQLDRELKRDAVLPPSDDDLRLMDPFAIRDPFHRGNDDGFEHPAGSPLAERLRQYGAALAAYRRALSRHAEEVAQLFDRGVASALANNSNASALRAWNSVPLEDPDLASARALVERIRKSLSLPPTAAAR